MVVAVEHNGTGDKVMNEGLFSMLARAFDGVATIGSYSAGDGHVNVHVWPVVNGQLPDHARVVRAIEVGDLVEARLGITVSVKVESTIPMRSIA